MKKQFVVIFLILCLILCQNGWAKTAPAAHYLLPNGRLNTAAIGQQQLNLDLKGWHVILDPKLGPVFSPTPPPADGFWALGSGFNSYVSSIAISGSDVYVVGDFTAVGSGGAAVTGLNRIAKWNTSTSTWSALDSGLNNPAIAIAISGSDVYVGGDFTDVGSGGTAVTGLNRIAKWNTTTSKWSALGNGLNNPVYVLAISGSDVYVGGGFTDVGSGGAAVSGLNRIAKWNTTTSAWSALGSGLNGVVVAIAFSGSDVYVGGLFTTVGSGGTPVTGLNRIAKWNTTASAWSALGSGLNAAVGAIAISGSNMYVGGVFTDVGSGGMTVSGLNRIAKWNTTTSAWSALGTGLNNPVVGIAISGSDLYVGGEFSAVNSGGSTLTGLNKIAKWNGTAWSALDNGLHSDVYPIAISGSDVYVGGRFTGVGSGGTTVVGLNYIARWGPCLAASTPTPTGILTWNGSVSTDWATACNWSPASVPAVGNDVEIPTGVTNQPSISTAALAKSVWVQTGATLSISATGSLTINGSKSFPFSFGTYTSAFYNKGTVQNSGQLTIGNTASVGVYGLVNTAAFNNNAGGNIKIDNCTIGGILNQDGTFTNAATISIGAVTTIGYNGLKNKDTFNNNTGGNINIDRSAEVGLINENGTFNNAANITIGRVFSVGRYGLNNQENFNNNAGGNIIIDNCTSAGIRNTDGTFINAANITIGAVASVGNNGLENYVTFNNNTGGNIKIDNCTSTGLNNGGPGTFTNAANITIGAVASVGDYGLINDYTFNNNTGGNINIDRSTTTGLQNKYTFTNAANITIGAVASVGTNGLENNHTFNNNACGKLIVKSGKIENYTSQTITNLGYVQVDGDLSNKGTFTNNGVLKYGTLTGSVTSATNPSVIVNNNATNATIFNYGGTFNGTINGIFKEATANNLAGTFTAPNAFVPSPTLPLSVQTLYAKITPNASTCSYIVPFVFTPLCANPVFTLSSTSPATCGGGSTGSLKLSGLVATLSYKVNIQSGGILVDEFTTAADANGAISKSNLSAGDYIVKATVGTCVSSTMSVSVVEPVASLPLSFESFSANFSGNQLKNLVTTGCKVIVNLLPNGANPVSGNVDAKVWVATNQPNGFVKRHYEITPATSPNSATGKLTLLFKQSEFNDFNAQNPAPARLLPTGPNDAAGIANILVFKRGGTSSDGTGLPSTYSGVLTTINPNDADVVWNNTSSYWEISFDVTGFSGFVIGTTPAGCVLPNITTEPTGAALCAGAGINLAVTSTNTTNYQWELNGTPIVGANSSTYSVPLATAADLGNYTVVLSNIVPACAVRSRMAIVESKVTHFMQMVGCNCGGNSDVRVFINGGTSPYSFDYQSASGVITVNNYTSASVITLNPKATQGRTISATDASGCKAL